MLLSSLLSFLLAFPAMAAPPISVTYSDFSNGLNDTKDPATIDRTESPDLLNVVIDEGALKPRNGFQECGVLPSGNAATTLFEYIRSDGSRKLIASDNGTVYQTGDCQNWTIIKEGLSSSAKPYFEVARNELWFVNRDTHPFVWDGVTLSTMDASAGTPSPAPPSCQYLEFWRERLWCARTVSNPSSLAFSALTDSLGNDLSPSTGTAAWPATNAFYIDRESGGPIYGIRAYRDNLYAFKENAIFRVIFNSDFDNAVVKTLSSVGTRFQDSIFELDNVLYFAGPDGFYAFDGDKSLRLTDNIEGKFRSLRQPEFNEKFKLWTDKSDFDQGTGQDTKP